jgi:hypothetical protein
MILGVRPEPSVVALENSARTVDEVGGDGFHDRMSICHLCFANFFLCFLDCHASSTSDRAPSLI